MARKPLMGKDNSSASIASVNLTDFPLGSPQSRAAARALLTRKNTLCQDDEDALVLCYATVHLPSSIEPCYADLEATAAYRRGMELHKSRHGEIVPADFSKHIERSTRTSLEFEYVFGREPKNGDVLTFEHVQVVRGTDALKKIFGPLIEAWQRQIPDLICPYKFEGDRLFRHLRKGACRSCNGIAATEGGWHEAIDEGPEWNWREVEKELKGWKCPQRLEDIPTIPAIMFLGVVDGKHACRPVH